MGLKRYKDIYEGDLKKWNCDKTAMQAKVAHQPFITGWSVILHYYLPVMCSWPSVLRLR